jgi:hypothetical protein
MAQNAPVRPNDHGTAWTPVNGVRRGTDPIPKGSRGGVKGHVADSKHGPNTSEANTRVGGKK